MKLSDMYPTVYATDTEIQTAKSAIGHRHDGPLTAFVLIARTTEYAARESARYPLAHQAAAEALNILLEEYGFVKTDAKDVPSYEEYHEYGDITFHSYREDFHSDG